MQAFISVPRRERDGDSVDERERGIEGERERGIEGERRTAIRNHKESYETVIKNVRTIFFQNYDSAFFLDLG